MKIEKVKLSQVTTNKANPRIITKEKFRRLVDSILVLPKMLEIRPIVVDGTMKTLGGNMRNEALKAIRKMSMPEIADRLNTLADFKSKMDGEKNVLLKWWEEWLKSPSVYIIRADELSEAEKKEFIIKDNVSFGTWDYDMLANQWVNVKLQDWGMDVWNAQPAQFGAMNNTSDEIQSQQLGTDGNENDTDRKFGDALPPELDGVDMQPDVLPKIEGEDKTAMERIIIVFPENRKHDILSLLGIESLDKIIYHIDEILKK